ncbi:60S ribosomal protein L4-B [Myotis brandtii]|uniref:60S ribosomal protein L4-B n=1 Tax=Myotis brandtii TaxID=109478 RepID=S7PBM4_MYOBR|nr:60S ribosomal protein L4-B [Myotis brandtii]
MWPSPLPTIACARPLISVYSKKGETSSKNATLPSVFKAPIQPDIVSCVHTTLCKSNRQPYTVSKLAGHQTNAESWGTGRASKKLVVGKKGKKTVGLKKQKKPVVGKKAAAIKNPAVEKKPTEKKPTTEEKKPVA